MEGVVSYLKYVYSKTVESFDQCMSLSANERSYTCRCCAYGLRISRIRRKRYALSSLGALASCKHRQFHCHPVLFFQYLDCLWAQIDKLRSDAWEEHHISRYYSAFDTVLGEALQHNLPTFVPPPHTETSVYPLPKVVFRLFDYTDCPEDVSHRFLDITVDYTAHFTGTSVARHPFDRAILDRTGSGPEYKK